MSDEQELDDYDKFLTTFDEEAVPALNYATIEPNLFEPLVQQRLLESAADGGAEVERAPYAQGQKQIAIDELALGALDFFRKRPAKAPLCVNCHQSRPGECPAMRQKGSDVVGPVGRQASEHVFQIDVGIMAIELR